jgi:hypothetical protein
MGASRSSAYELIVKKLLQSKLKAEGLADLKAFHLKKYKGKSGQDHAIDVSFEVKLGELELLFLVECKEYKRRAGADDMMEFLYRIRDIGAHKGILVTTHGFQEGAVALAKAERVGLLIAARGGIVSTLVCASPVFFEFFIRELQVSVSPETENANILGAPCETISEIFGAMRLDDTNDGVPLPGMYFGDVVFLLPHEEPPLDLPDLTPDAGTPGDGLLAHYILLREHFERFARKAEWAGGRFITKSVNIVDGLPAAD